jgi:heme-degrading monooxygenase HmoA
MRIPARMVVVVSNRIPVAKGWEAEFERRWADRKWSIASLPGFLRTEVLKPIKADYYVVVTHWRSAKDFEAWMESPAFGEAHANAPPKQAFAGPNVFEMHEVLAAKEPDAPVRRTPKRAAKRS